MPLYGKVKPAPPRVIRYEFAANHTGAMLAIPVPSDVAGRIALPGGEPVEDLHITLFFFGDAADVAPKGREAIIYTALGASAGCGPFEVVLDGTGLFPNNPERPFFARVHSPGLEELRARIAKAFDEADIDYSRDYEYRPHCTLKYLGEEPAPG
ncbi:MAG: 2'-5' RNA ligase family protein, partial [Candidatus Aenigmarchaeota archaeon]|nr:2'-5' RNA ligase family protein [Candidatus Aenigmarchaeota archaeon]